MFQFPSSLLKDHFSSAEVFYFGSIYIDRVGITRTPTEPLLAEKKMIFFFYPFKTQKNSVIELNGSIRKHFKKML